jgi:hypothetical protein
MTSSSKGAIITGNTIQNLTANNPSSNTSSFSLKGINIINNGITNATGFNINLNTIRNLVNLNTSGICNTSGIYLNNISNNKQDTFTPERQYPPGIITSFNTLLTGYLYGNGTYIISSSIDKRGHHRRSHEKGKSS